MLTLLILSACFLLPEAAPPVAEAEVVLRAPGLSPEEVEAQLVTPLEDRIAALDAVRGTHTRIADGLSLTTVTTTRAALHPVLDALDAAADAVATEEVDLAVAHPAAPLTDWIVPLEVAAEAMEHLERGRPLGGAFTVHLQHAGSEVVLPGDAAGLARLATVPPDGRWPDLDTLLIDAEHGTPLRDLAVRVGEIPRRVTATWDGEPVALVHVAGPRDEARRDLMEVVEAPVPVPTEHAFLVESWGDDETVDERAEALAQALRAAGAVHVLVLARRPVMMRGEAKGRVEVLGAFGGPGDVPLHLPEAPGVRQTVTPWPVVRRAVTGPPEALDALQPPPASEWDVQIDRDAATALGLSTGELARAVRFATVGTRVRLEDGTVVQVRAGEVDDVQALQQVVVAEHQGQPVPLSAVATLSLAQAPRLVERVDGQRAVVITHPPPEGATVSRTWPESDRYPW